MRFLKVLKYISIGAIIVNGIIDAAKDGKITARELLNIAIKVAEKMDFMVDNDGFEFKKK